MRERICGIVTGLLLTLCGTVHAGPAATQPGTTRGERMIADYFRGETAQISRKCLAGIKTREDWDANKGEYRRQLFEMLGLWPMPARTDLHPTITGRIESDEFSVERVYFQSMPHLYVTANLYIPKGLTKSAPAILYVCGHAKVKANGVSLGNKTFYQRHAEWFARNGYVCLIIDSLEMGEIEGIHHGTYSLGMWWWHDRGYTPAGVEAWNGIRALDYLCSRKEVDPNRIGMTGRSGGGAYTWYVAALDERVKVACPVAGITDLQNHIVDGAIEGHCDCMFMDNTYRWDFPQVAALVSPRPLLICNSDKDTLFPLDGVYRLHEQVRRIYALQGAEKNLGLLITEGPHQDTQDLQVPVFRWFNRFLKNDRGPIGMVAKPFFKPAELRVFDKLPSDQINTSIQETFGPSAPPPAVPTAKQDWERQRDGWMAQLKAKTFAAWPESPVPIDLREPTKAVNEVSGPGIGRIRLNSYRFTSQHDIDLDLFVAAPDGAAPESATLIVLGGDDWPKFAATTGAPFGGVNGTAMGQHQAADYDGIFAELGKRPRGAVAWFAPRGIGPTAWGGDLKKQTQIRRRFALLGETLDGMRVWDVRRAVQAVRSIGGFEHTPVSISAEGREAGIALYASLFEPNIARLDLTRLPASHRAGQPDLLNVLQTLDMPATVAMSAERCEVRLHQSDPAEWAYPAEVDRRLGWGNGRLQIEP
jgi:dienelactone hydrolase